MFRRIVLSILFLSTHFLLAQTYIIPNLQRDDFDGTSLHSWWKVGIYPSNSTKHQLSVNGGYLKADLVNPLDGANGGRLQSDYSGMENVGFSSVTDRIYDKRMVLDIRIRIKTLNALPPGSRGWGSWRSEGVPITINQSVWFMEQKPDPDSTWAADETWWRARTERDVNDQNDKHTDLDVSPYSIDNTQWHTYRLVRYSGSTDGAYYDHYVDGTLVQHITPNDFETPVILNEDYEFHCWNDNLVYHFIDRTNQGLQDTIEVFYNGWIGTSSFIVDFVEIRKNGFDPSYTVNPVNSTDFLRLRSYESEIDDGVSDGLWKSYSFDTNGGNTFVIVTAKAENLGSYGDDDDLKLVIDGTDYGYDNANSWNGDSDAGHPKTLVFTPQLSAGSHTIEVYSQATPILYDVNVLSSGSGAMVLDTTLNETAPEGSSNYLWKSLPFSCDDGPVAVYVSASADDEPGWDYKNADIDSTDDDELRIELDNTDYGWAGDYGFEGDSLHGDVKTVLIRDTLSAGNHVLKLYANETPTVYRVLVFAQNGDYSLPVQFSSFQAQKIQNRVHLSWHTESEVDNYGFNLYRAFSRDSTLPEAQAFVQINTRLIPGHGNVSRGYDYSFDDTLTTKAPWIWYRLYSYDYDGSVHLLKTISVKNESSDFLPLTSRLPFNYPNPFNPQTAIFFNLPENNLVRVFIYDIRGRKVRTLWQGELPAGEQRLIWNGRDDFGNLQSAGIYFYQIKTESQQWEGKMTFLK